MRTIKFRGISKTTGQFVYGMPSFDFKYIFDSDNADSPDNYEVIPESVGQFTGLQDKNGVDIYEGDIIESLDGKTEIMSWDSLAFHLCIAFSSKESKTKSFFDFAKNPLDNIEVIGNIHLNPELIK